MNSIRKTGVSEIDPSSPAKLRQALSITGNKKPGSTMSVEKSSI